MVNVHPADDNVEKEDRDTVGTPRVTSEQAWVPVSWANWTGFLQTVQKIVHISGTNQTSVLGEVSILEIEVRVNKIVVEVDKNDGKVVDEKTFVETGNFLNNTEISIEGENLLEVNVLNTEN